MKFLFFFSILCIFLSSAPIAAEKTDLSKFSCQPEKQKIDAFMLKEINPFSKSKREVCEPIKPAPPVINIDFINFLSFFI